MKRSTRGGRSVKLPFRIARNSVIVLVIGVALVVGSWIGLNRVQASYQGDSAKVAKLEKELNQIDARAKQLRNGIDPLANLTAANQKADEYLPATANKAELAQTMPAAAKQRGLEMTQLEPGEETKASGALKYLPVQITVIGTFDSLVGWLSDLQAPGSVTTVTDPAVTQVKNGSYRMAFTLKVWSSSTRPLSATSDPITTTKPATATTTGGGIVPNTTLGKPTMSGAGTSSGSSNSGATTPDLSTTGGGAGGGN